jgi:hypothetical protein
VTSGARTESLYDMGREDVEAELEVAELIRGGLYGTIRISSPPADCGPAPEFKRRGSRLGRGGEGDIFYTFALSDRQETYHGEFDVSETG